MLGFLEEHYFNNYFFPVEAAVLGDQGFFQPNTYGSLDVSKHWI